MDKQNDKPANTFIPRRKFLSNAAISGGLAAMSPMVSCSRPTGTVFVQPDYAPLDEALKLPVLKREFFPFPVIIETLELLCHRNNFICRVRSKDGADSISIGHPFISKNGYPMFKNLLQNRFIGKVSIE